MANGLFIFSLAVFFLLFLRWGFKTLPGEGWQIIASMPISRDESGLWKGVNLTYYGLFSANAYVTAITMLFILMGAIDVPLKGTFAMVVMLLLICVPASKLMARIVEKKLHTFTIGGASFVGIMIAPWAIWLTNITIGSQLGCYIPLIPTLAAFIIAYAFGEGMGRLACISFGCCYGKPLSRSRNLIQKLFHKLLFYVLRKNEKNCL